LLLLGAGFTNRSDKRIVRSSLGDTRCAIPGTAPEGWGVKSKLRSPHPASRIQRHVSRITPQPLFYPSWEVLPNDVRLPHSDVISERLEMLVTLTQHATHDYLAIEEYPSW
jgi:hypothetical protein